ncbi:MAG TPA: PE-PPE domain-containing protein, partial [Mycobacterium sp.]|nr:PE-PPE domain-containing protein [Mycobacterium sp.]
MTGWADLAANIAGTKLVKHAVLTYNGTWGAGLVQYPSDVVNGLAEYIDDGLCEEIACPYPASFGPIGGNATAPSYQQSIEDAIAWTAAWLAANPNRTFALIGYSQGAEAASRVYMELVAGTAYEANFIGGITFGNPSRMPGSSAPGVASLGPQWRGISSIIMTVLPTKNGRVIWADYAHNTANGDAANDMYPQVPNTQVGKIMTDVYTAATEAQLNNPTAFLQSMVSDLLNLVEDSGLLNTLKGGAVGLF